MGSAYFIILEREIAGLDTGMDGKSIAKYLEDLDTTAEELGVTPLSEFYSIDPEEAAEFMEMEVSEVKLPPVEFFPAEEGLATVRALASHVVARQGHVAEDLRQCERILTAASQQGVGWHFQVDV